MDQTLRISLPLRHISDQQKQDVIHASGKLVQSAQSKDERSCSARQQDSIQEQSGVAQHNQRPRHLEAIRQDDDKGKGSAAAEELKKNGGREKNISAYLAKTFYMGNHQYQKTHKQYISISKDRSSRLISFYTIEIEARGKRSG